MRRLIPPSVGLLLSIICLLSGAMACGKKAMSKEEARRSIEEVAALETALKQVENAESSAAVLEVAKNMVATAPMSKLVREYYIKVLEEELELENRLTAVMAVLEQDKWYKDVSALQNGIESGRDWSQFARERVRNQKIAYEEYVASAMSLAPAREESVKATIKQVLDQYGEYESLLTRECNEMVTATTKLFAFIIKNRSTMRVGTDGPYWDQTNQDSEFATLALKMSETANLFETRYNALMSKRAEWQNRVAAGMAREMQRLSE